MKVLLIFRVLSIWFSLFLIFTCSVTTLKGQESDAVVPDIQEEFREETPESKLLQPRELPDRVYSGKRSDSSLMWSVFLFLFMLIVIAGFWIYTKKGGMGLRKLSISNELRIRETKALGNRQFLVVVEYGEQRMLLGVAPGTINHLCYLETPEAVTGTETGADS